MIGVEFQKKKFVGPEQLCWPPDIYCGHWIDGQILADGGTLGKRTPWDSGKFGWSRFDQDVVGVMRNAG
jgi:hypothetical protein